MAVVVPGKAAPARPPREIHPAVFLLAGFGLIGLATALVHALFRML